MQLSEHLETNLLIELEKVEQHLMVTFRWKLKF